MARPQVDSLCFSLQFSNLFLKQSLPLSLELTNWLDWMGGTVMGSLFLPPSTGCVEPYAAVCVGAKNQTQVHMLAQQALYPLSLLSSPNYEQNLIKIIIDPQIPCVATPDLPSVELKGCAPPCPANFYNNELTV